MKFPAMTDDDIANLLREAARKIEAGEPLRFPDPATGVRYLQGPVVVAILRGLAEGKTVGSVMQNRRPKGRMNVEIVATVERAKKRIGTYAAAYVETAQQWHGDGRRPLRGATLKKAVESVKKAHQRARAAMQGQKTPRS